VASNFVFHESFDSTRTSDRRTAPNLAQAQAEALVSLLLGHSLSLTNTYAFDSRGVLDLTRAVLAARDEVLGALRPGSAGHRRLVEARPFLLCWHGAKSFLEACAGQLNRIDPDHTDNRFVLSAWNDIDTNPVRRGELATALLSGLDPEPPRWLDQYPGFSGQFDSVTAINRYARDYDRGRPTSTEKPVDLIDYLNHYQQLGKDGLLRPLAAKWRCPEDVAVKLWERIDAELRQKAGRDKLGNRSWIHVATAQVALDDAERKILVQLKELIDTFYNARLAQSGYADHGFLSSVPRTSDTEEMVTVNNLAIRVINHTRPDVTRPPLEGVFTAPADEPQLEVKPLQQLFRVYWDIVGDDDRYRTWQSSCEAVNDLLGSPARTTAAEEATDPERVRKEKSYRDWAKRFTAAWADHMGLLSRQLPEIVRTDDRTLQVVVRQGQSVFRHSHRLTGEGEQASPLDVDGLLATGGYVSKMASWVSV
jgi:hypothetical protein